MSRPNAVLLAALLVVVAVHAASIPRTIWEYDECLYASAIEKFEPLRHHPPPPGSPLFIGFGKLLAPLAPSTFAAMVATSVLAVAIGFTGFVLAFGALTDRWTGLLAALLLYFSPAVLIIGPLPQADAGALALFGFAIWACARKRPWLCGLLCAACVGWRMQLSIAVVPLFLATLVTLRSWRDRFIATSVFGVTCVVWLAPLVVATGGVAGFWKWMSGQAAYFAAHDADLSRSGHSMASIALRFIAHPWGPKWLSLPLLGLAALGLPRASPRLAPLACGSLAYLAFALATMDPADAVRYAIPSLPLVALLAALALRSLSLRSHARNAGVPPAEQAPSRRGATAAGRRLLSRPEAGVPIVFAIGALIYTFPILHARATSPSPPFAAAAWIQTHIPKDAVVLYDVPLMPHAEYLLRGFTSMRFSQYDGTSSRPAVVFADGELGDAKGVTFRWPDTDAYRKLTRQHYGAVSVIPLRAEERFRVVEGVFAPERTRDGRAWRWIGARGVIALPQRGAARVTLRTPPEYPLAENRVRVNGVVATLRRDQSVSVVVPETDTITIEPERTFVPANVAGANNRDKRVLSVMLTRVERFAAPPSAAGSPPGR